MAEDLTEYYQQLGLRVRYLHSDIDTLDGSRSSATSGRKFDGLIGINLLREGSTSRRCRLVAILDADKEGYSGRASLIQTAGRRLATSTARSSCTLIHKRSRWRHDPETERRRVLQGAYNEANGITPESHQVAIHELLRRSTSATIHVPSRRSRRGVRFAGGAPGADR